MIELAFWMVMLVSVSLFVAALAGDPVV